MDPQQQMLLDALKGSQGGGTAPPASSSGGLYQFGGNETPSYNTVPEGTGSIGPGDSGFKISDQELQAMRALLSAAPLQNFTPPVLDSTVPMS